VAEPFGKRLAADQVAHAIGRGLQASASIGNSTRDGTRNSTRDGTDAGALGVETYALQALPHDFEARMHRTRAVVIAAGKLDRHTLLQRGAVFETATKARQGGVPCYAVTAKNALDAFEARILDLQVVLEAGDARALLAAGRELAKMVQ
jgi:glycerate kinase